MAVRSPARRGTSAVARLVALLFASALIAGVFGCASFQAGRERTRRLQHELDALRYSKPLDEVWQEARRLLSERGFPLASEDAAAIGASEMSLAERIFSPERSTYRVDEDVALLQASGVAGSSTSSVTRLGLDTGWGKGTPRERRHLEALAEGEQVRVVIVRVVEDVTDHRESSARDLELELELARRLDAAAADRIQAELATTGK
jgi:hypothetical protein